MGGFRKERSFRPLGHPVVVSNRARKACTVPYVPIFGRTAQSFAAEGQRRRYPALSVTTDSQKAANGAAHSVDPVNPINGHAQDMRGPPLSFWFAERPQADVTLRQKFRICRKSENRNEVSVISVNTADARRMPGGIFSFTAISSKATAVS